jgi:hypothetical protein
VLGRDPTGERKRWIPAGRRPERDDPDAVIMLVRKKRMRAVDRWNHLDRGVGEMVAEVRNGRDFVAFGGRCRQRRVAIVGSDEQRPSVGRQGKSGGSAIDRHEHSGAIRTVGSMDDEDPVRAAVPNDRYEERRTVF